MINNPFTLQNKTILITGASSGIGRATAIACSQMGAKLFITGRNPEKLQETFDALEGTGHSSFCADLADLGGVSGVAGFAGVTALAEKAPELDGLVNNAGIVEIAPVNLVNREKLDKVFSINTYAPIFLLQELLRNKKIKDGASVVFTSSIAGNFVFSLGHSMYSSSKAAVDAFARSAALELARRKIRVNNVCPGMIETDLVKNGVFTPQMLAEDAKKYPLKRYGKPEEVAYGIVYLLSDASSFVTGIELVIDGGCTLS